MGPLLLSACLGAALLFGQESGVVEPGGARIELRDGQAVRVSGAEPTVLHCTSEGGTGPIADLSADPAGLTYFAAENGLFVLGPLVDHLDPVWRREGAPAGTPRSVHVDDRRRVWLATDEAVGVLEPSFGWGTTLDLKGLTPPYRLEPSEGGLRIEGGGAETLYVPDQAPAPRVSTLEINGVPTSPNAVLDGNYGETQRLTASGNETAQAFRFRVDGHHVWRDLEESGGLKNLSPGEHLVEVVAVDRDLNLSEPFPVRLRVALPVYYRKGFVLAAGALVGLVVLALSLLLQRPGTPPLRRALAGVATTGVVLVFGVQILAGLIPHAKGWPFVGYSMYTKSFPPELPVHRPVLIARTPAGDEREIPPWALGYAIDGRWQVLGPIVNGGADVERDALERVRQRVTGPGYDVLQVQSRRFRLTPNGPIPIAPLVLSHYRWEGP